MREQSRAVWHFILDREVEAPARFCSIQTFRAALAVMTQQVRLPACPASHRACLLSTHWHAQPPILLQLHTSRAFNSHLGWQMATLCVVCLA